MKRATTLVCTTEQQIPLRPTSLTGVSLDPYVVMVEVISGRGTWKKDETQIWLVSPDKPGITRYRFVWPNGQAEIRVKTIAAIAGRAR